MGHDLVVTNNHFEILHQADGMELIFLVDNVGIRG